MLNGNKIYKIDKNGNKREILGFIKGLRISFKGKKSSVTFGYPMPKFHNSHISLCNNCHISFDSNSNKIKSLLIRANTNDGICHIGKDFKCSGCEIHYGNEVDIKVNIGDDCLFADGIVIRASDSHSIKDMEGNTINLGKEINIGNHVWVASNVTILKNLCIADNTVIATGSIVTKDCNESNAIYAGNPAKLVKTNINWDKASPVHEGFIPIC